MLSLDIVIANVPNANIERLIKELKLGLQLGYGFAQVDPCS